MRVALTGTPGTGKTTVANHLDAPVVDLNEVIEREGLWTERDDDRDSLVADLDAVETWLDANAPEGLVVVDSHLAHHLPADRVVVLRCHPDTLVERLEERDVDSRSVEENARSEALDVVLGEAISGHGHDSVYEIDTTDRTPEAVAADVRAVVAGERDPSAGTVDFTDYL